MRKNASTVMNLGITVKIALILTSETLERITTEAHTGEKTKEVETRAPVKTTHDSTITKHTRQHLITTLMKNTIQNLLHPDQ